MDDNMAVKEMFADTRTVQGSSEKNHHYVTIPLPVVEELNLQPGDNVLWKCDEGEGEARLVSLSD